MGDSRANHRGTRGPDGSVGENVSPYAIGYYQMRQSMNDGLDWPEYPYLHDSIDRLKWEKGVLDAWEYKNGVID